MEEWKQAPLTEDTESTDSEEWRQAPLAESSAEQKAEVLAGSISKGIVETTPIVTGAVMGGQIGMASGNPLVGLAGVVAGGTIGYFAGDNLKKYLQSKGHVSPEVEDLPQDLRPYGFAGEVIGTGVPLAGLPQAVSVAGVKFGPTAVGNFLNKIIERSVTKPGRFLAEEGAGLFGAGLAGGVAESYFPGETGVRIGAEVVGGFFNPTRLVISTSQRATDSVKSVIQSMTRAGRESKGAEVLKTIVEGAGEDPIQLAKALKETSIPGLNVTSAQKTGSDALILLESKLASQSAKFGLEEKKMAEAGLEVIKESIEKLRGVGTPEALKAAAELRTKYFRTLIASRLQASEAAATTAAARIAPKDSLSRSQLAKEANELLENSMKDVRSAESELWEKVPRTVAGRAENVVIKYNNLRNQLLPEEKMPAVVEGFVKRMKESRDEFGRMIIPQGTTSGELILFRSRTLALAREAAGKGDLNDARIYGELAESALDDLDNIGNQIPEFTEARTFSRELNDVFTSTFAGEALRFSSTGGSRIPPELMMRRALGPGAEAGALRLSQIERAMAFLPQKGLEGPEHFDAMMRIQNNFIRMAASESIDPNTGRASATRLTNFLKKNSEILDRFPDIRDDIQKAVTSEVGLKDMERISTNTSRIIEKQTAFGKLGKFENPSDAVNSAITSANPVKELNTMAKLAKRGGPDAVEGMKASVFDNAIRKSSNEVGDLSFDKLRSKFFKPIREGQPSLSEIMVKNGVMDQNEVTHLNKLLTEAEKIEKAINRQTGLEELAAEPSGSYDLIVRVVGARAGSSMARVGGGAGGHELIAAGAGVRYAKKVMEKIPQNRVRDVLIEAELNPQFGAMLLEKPKSQREAAELGRQIHAYILQAGFTSDDSLPEE